MSNDSLLELSKMAKMIKHKNEQLEMAYDLMVKKDKEIEALVKALNAVQKENNIAIEYASIVGKELTDTNTEDSIDLLTMTLYRIEYIVENELSGEYA